MDFRIKKYRNGYVVEVKKVKNYLLFKKYYWTHYISVSGIEKQPWYHSEFHYAMSNLLEKVEYETISNSKWKLRI